MVEIVEGMRSGAAVLTTETDLLQGHLLPAIGAQYPAQMMASLLPVGKEHFGERDSELL